ncbi:hypothetical protein ONZ45_g2593 [Pleurotus djamor]|nr:hypothetical protein ONZ45_g2593 [Pleurotus djamor]
MNIASLLSPDQSVEMGDALIPTPTGLRVVANVRTGVVYSFDRTALFLLGRCFIPEEGGVRVNTFSVAFMSQDGSESQQRIVIRSELSAASVVALQNYARENAVMLSSALGSPPVFYIVGSFERHDNTYVRLSGVTVRRQAQAGVAAAAAAPPACQSPQPPSISPHR